MTCKEIEIDGPMGFRDDCSWRGDHRIEVVESARRGTAHLRGRTYGDENVIVAMTARGGELMWRFTRTANASRSKNVFKRWFYISGPLFFFFFFLSVFISTFSLEKNAHALNTRSISHSPFARNLNTYIIYT